MENCLFCKIASGKLPSNKRFEDDLVVAFDDIHPQAKTHILIIPKKHINSAAELESQDANLIGQMVLAAKALAEEAQIHEKGYRLVFNTKKDGGQIIDHIHLHLIGGQKLGSMV